MKNSRAKRGVRHPYINLVLDYAPLSDHLRAAIEALDEDDVITVHAHLTELRLQLRKLRERVTTHRSLARHFLSLIHDAVLFTQPGSITKEGLEALQHSIAGLGHSQWSRDEFVALRSALQLAGFSLTP